MYGTFLTILEKKNTGKHDAEGKWTEEHSIRIEKTVNGGASGIGIQIKSTRRLKRGNLKLKKLLKNFASTI